LIYVKIKNRKISCKYTFKEPVFVFFSAEFELELYVFCGDHRKLKTDEIGVGYAPRVWGQPDSMTFRFS
jgi:hypothetical protein